MKKNICLGLMVLLFLFLLPLPQAAPKIYKYKDRDGNWCFTNDPELAPEYQETDNDQEPVRIDSQGNRFDLQARFSESHPAATEVEQARNATVAIKTSAGHGSGFFITEDGYILTNKHVVAATEEDKDRFREAVQKQEQKFREVKRRLDTEHREIRRQERELGEKLAKIGLTPEEYEKNRERLWKGQRRLRDPSYALALNEIETMTITLKRGRANYRREKEQLEHEKQAFSQWKRDQRQRLNPSNITILLVDNSSLPVSVVANSYRYDVSLLRLQGYKTPYIKPGDLKKLSPGEPLYAIGCPLDLSLRHTVTSGIFSAMRRFDEDTRFAEKGEFLQTTAQVNPGNSGGPLVDGACRVVGINT